MLARERVLEELSGLTACKYLTFLGYDIDGICLTIFELLFFFLFCTFCSQCALLDGFLSGVAFYLVCSRTARPLQSPPPPFALRKLKSLSWTIKHLWLQSVNIP